MSAAVGARVKALKDKLDQTYKNISDRTDALTARLDAADAKHSNAIGSHLAELDSIEEGVAAVEQLTRQMSNGGPPLDPSSKPTPKPDPNGVTVNQT